MRIFGYVRKERPVHLDLFKFRFPIMAIVSILHRISGVIIFLLLPALFYLLHQSLVSQQQFDHLAQCLAQPVGKVFMLIVILATLFHLLAGIRHIVMDMGFAESKAAGRASAWGLILLVIILTVFMGMRLW